MNDATITVSLDIENIYEEVGTIKTTVTDAVIPAPPTTDRESDDWDAWAYDNLFQLTGTGRESGNAAYFATITACSDASLVGAEFEWGT